MTATDLFDLAAEWLAVCEEAVATTPGGAITRAFVSGGAPAFDCCPQLTVHSVGTVEAPTATSSPLGDAQRSNRQPVLIYVGLYATVVRCAPVLDDDGTFPDATELETTANQTMSDLWAILNYTRQRHRENLLFPSPSGRREMAIDPQVSVPTSGGCAGWTIPIRVQLGGYPIGS